MSEGSPRPGTGRLAVKIFIVALVAALVVAAAVLAAHLLWAPPDQEVSTVDALSRGRIGFTATQRDRYARLGLAARLLATEPALVSVLSGEAGDGEETPAVALADLLLQRREDLGYDSALVLDADGAVVASSDAPDLVATNLADRALVARGLDEGAAGGVWRRADGRLAHASLVWVAPDFDLLGYVVTAATLDEVLALEIERTSGADATFLVADGGGVRNLGSSLDAAANADLAAGVTAASGELAGTLAAGEVREGLSARLGGDQRDLSTLPLRDARDSTLGALVLSVPRQGAVFDPLPLAVAAGVAAALLVALLAALLLARVTLTPVRRLSELVAASPREGFARHPEPRRHGHLAPLAAALGRLFRGLQEDRVLADSAARAASAASGAAAAAGVEPQAGRATVVAVDLRRYARSGGDLPRDVAERMARDTARVRSLVAARGGRLVGAAGHRLIAAFDGDDAAWDAVTAGAAALAALGERESAFDEGEPPAVAVAGGPVTRGPLPGAAADGFLVGPAVQLVDSLLREAGEGDLVMPRAIHSQVAGQLSAHGTEASEQRGVLTPQPIFVVAAAAAGRLAAAVPAVTASAAGPGDVLEGRFEVLERVAVSAGGELLRAQDRELGEVVALRRFAAGVVRLPPGAYDAPLGAARRFAHPSVARLYDYGEAEGGPGAEDGFQISREWVPGVGAHQLGEMPPTAALGLGRQLAVALAAVHGAGLAHGRLKPENVLVAADGTVRLTDLGVSTVAGSSPSRAAGQRMLAPEQANGAAGDARSDVYAAGALLAWLATGEWRGGLGSTPEEGGVSPSLGAFLRRCLEEEPAKRFADGGEMLIALEGVAA